ncbi:MAG: methylenetetrahydrofolate reductase [NAD(P)H] [Bacteroidia bacterium]|nr:methylenetetrahydrofolate reductase [NAD(P)H] [Bacteroidia bacterium]
MKVTEHIEKLTGPKVSFEILPPTKGSSIQTIYDTLDPLMEFKPPYINITYHQAEVDLKQRPDGLLEPRVVRKRPGTVAISAAIQNRYGVDVVPHLICGGFSKEETEDALIDLHYLGIHNVLVVRGDANPLTGRFTAEKNGHEHALDLLKQVVDLKNGIYLEDDLENPEPLDFSPGVAAYPEKHLEAPNFESDLFFLKAKVDAGAEYVVTQMFFDNRKFFSFVEACRNTGITVPIIPGIKPVSIKRHLNILPQTFKVDIPPELSREMDKCKNNDEVRQVGIEWAIRQSKELIAAGVPIIHFFTMGKADNIRKIAKGIL